MTTDDMDRENSPMAEASGGDEGASAVGGDSARCGGEHGVRGRTGADEPDSRDTRPDRATRYLETTRGILSYQEAAALLAPEVARAEARIVSGDYSNWRLDEELWRTLHRSICGGLVPDWAGEWRRIEVRVGNLNPPPPHMLPVLMRDFCRDLEARWAAASAALSELTLEFLAFAEGRFLAIHPFQDFNGRTVRLFLTELLRRLDLPLVDLAPADEGARKAYFAALEAADARNWLPLVVIWQQRIAEAPAAPSASDEAEASAE